MSTIRGLGEIAIEALNQTWKKELPWILPPIPLFPVVLKKFREEQIEAVIIAPLWPGQIWYIELVNENVQSLMLGWSNQILEPGISLIKKNLKLLPGRICCFLMDRRPEKIQYPKKILLCNGKLQKWTQINHYTIIDLLKMKSPIIIPEVLAQFTSVNTSASSALQFLNRLSSMLLLTFDIDLKNNHMLQFTRKAISPRMIVKPKNVDTKNVGKLFDYWREKGSNRNLTNIELQTKLTSLLMTICSMRPAEIQGKSLRHSVICKQTDKVDLRLQQKTKSRLH
ncbi:MAG: hypothetical protein EZS28_030832 [Streblomastix strix]|uniref:Tyr recombinase domain-containing protein n=1 Tax=Streblomastix strix TaxID=222440 RepID=A0A5J4UUP0_9EUKA|nr:MAG: hypothetical protein EZS28_030832 [Streblomastix strix]